jgi:hypothetical protein
VLPKSVNCVATRALSDGPYYCRSPFESDIAF